MIEPIDIQKAVSHVPASQMKKLEQANDLLKALEKVGVREKTSYRLSRPLSGGPHRIRYGTGRLRSK
jgi:ABC-type oligopeptide transport system ATPase subunit